MMLNLPFRNPMLARELVRRISDLCSGGTFMEVCGSHTAAVRKNGLDTLLPPSIRLLSGPGCPVCVTGPSFIDKLCIYALEYGYTVAAFGDLARIPGTKKNLQQAKAEGADIVYIYSPREALKLAAADKGKNILFPAIGFETTAPLAAALLEEAGEEGLDNLFMLCALKTMPAALEILAARADSPVDGFLLPGHVSAVTGTGVYRFLPEKYGRAAVVAGFEPLDILQALWMLARQKERREFRVENQYTRLVKAEGNRAAAELTERFFSPCDSDWRGLGVLAGSGLSIRDAYGRFDMEKRLPLTPPPAPPIPACLCGDILRGVALPAQCPLFAKDCTPENPRGACMVSREGACNAHYSYERADRYEQQ